MKFQRTRDEYVAGTTGMNQPAYTERERGSNMRIVTL